MRADISVIVPIYNVEKYLEICINSIREQTKKNIEIILVDDESPDNCPKICDDFAKIDNRIKVIHKKNGGLGLARNSGLEIAEGKYVCFIDSDDYIEKEMLEKLYEKIENDNCDTVLSGFIKDIEGSFILNKHIFGGQILEGRSIQNTLIPSIIGADKFGQNKCFSGATCGLYSLDIIKKRGIKFPSEREYISEDIIFNLIYYRYAEKVSIIEDCYYYYRLNDLSLTKQYKKERFSKNIILYNKLTEICKESNIYNICLDRLYNSLITNARICIIQEVNNIKINGYKKCKKNIEMICENKELKMLLLNYDYSSLPLKQKIICRYIKNNNVKNIIIVSLLNKILKDLMVSKSIIEMRN